MTIERMMMTIGYIYLQLDIHNSFRHLFIPVNYEARLVHCNYVKRAKSSGHRIMKLQLVNTIHDHDYAQLDGKYVYVCSPSNILIYWLYRSNLAVQSITLVSLTYWEYADSCCGCASFRSQEMVVSKRDGERDGRACSHQMSCPRTAANVARLHIHSKRPGFHY